MTKGTYYRVSLVLSAVGYVAVVLWGITNTPWALWTAAGGLGGAVGMLVGGYIETEE